MTFIKGNKLALGNHPKTEFKKGHYMSIEVRKKISRALNGIKRSKETRKKISNYVKQNHPMKGKPSPLLGKKRPDITGDKHPRWNPNGDELHRIRTSFEYKLWRDAVFERDNYTCQLCNIRGGSLEAHHKKSFAKFPELRTSIENGITLCVKCHAKVDVYRKLKKQ